MKKQIIIIFFVALFLRIGAYVVFDYTGVGSPDQEEYLYNSTDLEVHPELSVKYGYTKWYHRTPTYTLFLYLINQNIIIQILLSCIAVVLLYKIHPFVGWVWCLFPEDIFYSGITIKGSLMIFFIVLFIYLFRNYKNTIYFIPFIVWLCFISYTLGIVEYNLNKTSNIFENIFIMWQPLFPITKQVTGHFLTLLNMGICFGIAIVIIRDIIKNKNWRTMGFFLFYTAVWNFGYSPKYKYYIMPVILILLVESMRKWSDEEGYFYWGENEEWMI